jgi:hypothetical protein
MPSYRRRMLGPKLSDKLQDDVLTALQDTKIPENKALFQPAQTPSDRTCSHFWNENMDFSKASAEIERSFSVKTLLSRSYPYHMNRSDVDLRQQRLYRTDHSSSAGQQLRDLGMTKKDKRLEGILVSYLLILKYHRLTICQELGIGRHPTV